MTELLDYAVANKPQNPTFAPMTDNGTFIVEGGHRLSGEIIPQGAKNEALQIISATLMTEEPVLLTNLPDILDVNKAARPGRRPRRRGRPHRSPHLPRHGERYRRGVYVERGLRS